jgi:hypothetical protein
MNTVEMKRAADPADRQPIGLLVPRGGIAGDRNVNETSESCPASPPATSPAPAYDKSIEFLRQFAPEGPWVLTAISPDERGIATRTFRPADEQALRAWLEMQGQRRNLYFMVNPPTRDLGKKAEETDVAALAWLHVDIDPRAGEDINAERERALRLLRNPPGDLPAPTCIIDSGGGFQGFWKLAESLPIDGDLARQRMRSRTTSRLSWCLALTNATMGPASCGCPAQSIGPTR